MVVESGAEVSSKVEKVVARSSDPVDGEPPMADVSSGCWDPQVSISKPGWYPPKNTEKIFLWYRRTTVLGRCQCLSKTIKQLLMLRSRVTIWIKIGSIYIRSSCISFAGKYDICCLIYLTFEEMKIVASEVAAREFSNARAVKRSNCQAGVL